jgi:hypothetical protein
MPIGEPREPRLSPEEEIRQQIKDLKKMIENNKGKVDKETMKVWNEKKEELETELSKLEGE